ncbi:hypothetical protein DYQ86_08925 [Acidobacteria bacterium AB60]|nr:hypothetical protein DYQ86_08925 [Acidobacteria bacterium AB60]
MSEFAAVWKALEATPVAASVRESLWLFPAIETLHLLGMGVVFTSIAAFDLRLLGLAFRTVRVQDLAQRLLPWTWTAFALQVITGALLFASEASRMAINPAFRLKMLLLALAGLHALVFRFTADRADVRLAVDGRPPVRARIAGTTSLLLWIGVVAAGRWIGFI